MAWVGVLIPVCFFFILFGIFRFAKQQVKLRQTAEIELKEAHHQIRSRERKIQTILNNAPIVFSAIDAHGIFQISEGKGLEKLGRKNNQSVGVSIYDMHNRNPVILEAVSKALKGERVATAFELNGISYDLFLGPEKNEVGEVTGVSMLSVDITDRKKAEEEKTQLLAREQSAIETSKLKGEFLANMSHEIRTPINGVLGMTSLLLDTSLNSEQREYALAIKQSGAGLLTVINDILDFSKIESGKLEFELLHFELSELIEHALKSLTFLAEKKGITFSSVLAPALPVWVVGDPGRFRQILNNLVANAIKFTEKGHVWVRVFPDLSDSLAPSPHHQTVRVEIEDTGIGISQQKLDKMFVAFSQAEASMSRRFGGTGLGLSISKQLVEKMGGQIGVTSTEGKGSVFWYFLPFQIGEAPRRENSSKPTIQSVYSGDQAPRILVAEDNRVNQTITLRMLQKMGCSADVVSDGLDAMEALKKSSYDLVLMDCQMPTLDGLEATQRIRAGECGPMGTMPIIAMTANAMKGDKETCIAAGMDDYVSKPISYEELNTVVIRWLEIQKKRAT